LQTVARFRASFGASVAPSDADAVREIACAVHSRELATRPSSQIRDSEAVGNPNQHAGRDDRHDIAQYRSLPDSAEAAAKQKHALTRIPHQDGLFVRKATPSSFMVNMLPVWHANKRTPQKPRRSQRLPPPKIGQTPIDTIGDLYRYGLATASGISVIRHRDALIRIR